MGRQNHINSLKSRYFVPIVLASCILTAGQRAWAGGAPDLVIDSILVTPTAWLLDQSVYIEAEVRNDGDAASNATTADFYLSVDPTIDTADQDFGDDNIVALNPDMVWFADLETVLTPDPGTYWIGVCVRPADGEADTANNCSEGVQVTIQENENICETVPLSCGASVSTSLTTQDCDDSPRGRSHYAKVHTFQGLSGTDVNIAAEWESDGFLFLESPSGAVVAENDDDGDFLHSRIEYTLDADGTWTVWATSFFEFDVFGYDIELACENVPVTDLAVTSIDAEPQIVAPGGDMTITATTENQGTITSESTTLRYFLSQDNEIETTDGQLGTDPVGPLEAGAETEDNISTSAPNSPGVYYVGACVDEVEGEVTTNNNCSAAVQLTVQTGVAIPITAGLNDAWFNRATDGQGFFFNVFPGREEIFVGWFTYDVERPDPDVMANIGEPGHRWLIPFGSFAPTLGTLDLLKVSDGVFNSGQPVTEVEDGTFDVSFSDCMTGTVEFDITSAGISGVIPIERISDDNVPLCEELSGSNPSNVLSTFEIDPLQVPVDQNFTVSWTTDGATECTPEFGTGGWANLDIDPAGGNVVLSPDELGLHVFDLTCSAVGEEVTKRARVLATASLLSDPPPPPVFQISEGLNDAWFNPNTSGQGFFINVFPGRKELFLSWFTYDTERPDPGVMAEIGEPGHRWFTAFGPYDDNRAELNLELTIGGVFNDAPPDPVTSSDGSIEVEFMDCENAIVSFDIASAGLVDEIFISRISGDNTELCEALSGGGVAVQ